MDVVGRWDRAFKSGSDKRFPSLDLVRLEQWYFEGKSGAVLDYGCGSGVNLIYLLERGYRVDGVDASIEAVRLTERKLLERPDFASRTTLKHIGVEAVTLPFQDETFDYLVCLSVLSLLGTRERVTQMLKEFRRVLKRGGKAILDVNGPDSDFAKKGPRVSEDVYEYVDGPDDTVIRSYCPADEDRFRKLLEPHFKIDDIGFTAHRYMGRENFEYIACARRP
jgi:SAM-dependent methyltransferase